MNNHCIKKVFTVSALMLTLHGVAAQPEAKEATRPSPYTATKFMTPTQTVVAGRKNRPAGQRKSKTTQAQTAPSQTSSARTDVVLVAAVSGAMSPSTPSSTASTVSKKRAPKSWSWDKTPIQGAKTELKTEKKSSSSEKAFAFEVGGENLESLRQSCEKQAAQVALKQAMILLQHSTHRERMLARETESLNKRQEDIAKRLEANKAAAEKRAKEASTNSFVVTSNITKHLELIDQLRAKLGMSAFTAANPRHPRYVQATKVELSDTVLVSAQMASASSSASSSSSSSSSQKPAVAETAPARSGLRSLLGF